jgi:hypothetical protein
LIRSTICGFFVGLLLGYVVVVNCHQIAAWYAPEQAETIFGVVQFVPSGPVVQPKE